MVWGVTTTVATARTVGSATLMSVIVTVPTALPAGAAYQPSCEMVPLVADQVTETSLIPLTRAVNCTLPLEETVVLAGDISKPMIGAAPAATSMLSILEPTTIPLKSAAVTANRCAPDVRGVPEIMPVFASSTSPEGSVPAIRHL